MDSDLHITGIVKGDERYIVLFDEAHRADALRTIGRWASNAELSFSWYDAARVSQRIRKTEIRKCSSH